MPGSHVPFTNKWFPSGYNTGLIGVILQAWLFFYKALLPTEELWCSDGLAFEILVT